MTKQYRNHDEVSTEATEDSSIVDSIMSTFCCNASYDSIQSYNDDTRKKKEILRKKKAKEEQAANISSPTVWERLSELVLFFVQGAPPVKFVKCFECSSVDESEVTTPPILIDMAREYDRKTKSKYQAISPADHASTTTEGGEINPATSLKPLLLRYARSGLRRGGGGGSTSSKSASKLRKPSENKQGTKSSRMVHSQDAKSHASSNESRSEIRQNVSPRHTSAVGGGGRSGRSIRDKHSKEMNLLGLSKRSKKSLKFEI